METEGFYTLCTTCSTRLKVRDQSAIGQIFGCPKCGSMVLVEPPEGWEPSGDSIAENANPVDSAEATLDSAGSTLPPSPSMQPVTPTAAKVTWLNASFVAFAAVVLIGVTGTFAWRTWNKPTPVSHNSAENVTSPSIEDSTTVEPTETPTESVEADVASTDNPNAPNTAPLVDSASDSPSQELVDFDPIQEHQPDETIGAPITDDVEVSEVFAEATSTQGDEPSNSEVGNRVNEEPGRPRREGTLLSDSTLTPSLGGPSMDAGDTLANLASLLGAANSNPSQIAFTEELESTEESEPTSVETSDEPIELRPRPNATLSNIHGEPKAGTPSHARHELIGQKLEKKLLGVRFEKVTLLDFLRSMMELSGVPVQIDPAAIRRTSAKLSSPVSIAAIDKSTLEVMRTSLRPLKLVPVVDGNVVKISTATSHATKNIQHSFIVEDQRGSNLDVVALVKSFIASSSWSGDRKVELRGEKLTVTNSRNTIFDTLTLLEKLRSARGLEPSSKLPAYRTSTSTRWSQANRYLRRPISVSIWHSQRWPDVVAELEASSGMRILVDWQALAHLGVTPNTETSLRVRDQSAARVFADFFEAFDLVVVPLGGKTVQLTSRSRMLETPYIEFYEIARLSQEPRQLLDDLVKSGKAVVDGKSNHAIVFVNSETHRKLAN